MEVAFKTSPLCVERVAVPCASLTAKGSERQISPSKLEQARIASLPWPLLLARICMMADEISAYQ
jgi:hypothetical protein